MNKRDKIMGLLSSGLTNEEIAERVGCSVPYVYDIKKNFANNCNEEFVRNFCVEWAAACKRIRKGGARI